MRFLVKVVIFYLLGFLLFCLGIYMVSYYVHSQGINRNSIDGNKFPEYVFLSEEGNPVNIKSFKGKYLLMDFWYAGCKPCLKEMKYLPELASKNPEKLVLLSVSIDNPSYMNSFLSNRRQKGDSIFMKKSNWLFINAGADDKRSKKLIDKLKISSYPTYILIDKTGKIMVKPISQLAVIQTQQVLGNSISISDYFRHYSKLLPQEKFTLKKFLIAYTFLLFLPLLVIFILIKEIIRFVRREARIRASKN